MQRGRHDCSSFPALLSPRTTRRYAVAAFPRATDTANTSITAAPAAYTTLPPAVSARVVGTEQSEGPRVVWFSAHTR